MEAVVNETGVLRPWLQKLAEFFPISRRSELERELSEAKAQTGRQKKHTERVQQRYGLLDKRYVALSNEADGLRSRLYAAERQTEAFKAVVKALCTAVGTAEDLKRIYQVAASCLDDGGFNLFDAAQEITGFRLGREFPYNTLIASKENWTLTQQPGASQDQVLKEFREDENSVLLGTSAYWRKST